MSLQPPINSRETTDGTACESEGSSGLSVLRSVRQVVSLGRAELCLRTLPRQSEAQRAWTARRFRTSRSTARNDGWRNWRRNSRKRRIRPVR